MSKTIVIVGGGFASCHDHFFRTLPAARPRVRSAWYFSFSTTPLRLRASSQGKKLTMCKSFAVALAVVALPVVALAGNPSQDASKAAARKFEGTWQLVSAMTDGKPTPADVVSQIHIVIKDGKHSVFYKDQVLAEQIPFVIDARHIPYEATDTLPDGKQIKGIYKIDGDVLTSCVSQPGKDRPTEFASKPGTGQTLRIFKRAKP
jgi:uncharacterized protein (TIGR03067 family)